MLRRNENPGKYEGGVIIDQYVHQLTMDGADDEAGDVSEYGEWFGLIRGHITDIPADADVNEEEREYLSRVAGAIVREDDQGFVTVDYYDTTSGLEYNWGNIVAGFSEDEDTSEDEADDEV